MGSGKTTVAKLLHRHLPRTMFISWDELKGLVSGYGQGADDKALLGSIQTALVKNGIKNNLSIILDAGFARSERIRPFIKLAKQNKYKFLIYQFTAPHHILLQRALSRPKLFWEKKKISRAKIVRNLRAHRTNKYRGKITAEIDSSFLTTEQITKKILKDVN